MQIEIIDPDPNADISVFKNSIKEVLSGESKISEYVNVVFLSKDELRSLKQQYFGQDVYTDVIAFNLNDPNAPIEGEIYLSFEQIRENALYFGTDLQNELYRVLIHGCLHLCGYEDETVEQKSQMTALEDNYLSKTGSA